MIRYEAKRLISRMRQVLKIGTFLASALNRNISFSKETSTLNRNSTLSGQNSLNFKKSVLLTENQYN